MPPKLRLGKGAVISCLLNKIHPKKVIATKYFNAIAQQRLKGGNVVKQEVKIVSNKAQSCIIFIHGDLAGEKLHAVE